MSQEAVRELLLELGGRATTAQIRDLAQKRYPKLTLHAYVGKRLSSMEKRREVVREIGPDGFYWVLVR